MTYDLVVGRGAVACLLAGRLISNGATVAFWRPGYGPVAKRVALRSSSSSIEAYELSVGEPWRLEEHRPAHVFVAVKSYQVLENLSEVSVRLPHDAPVFMPQNGTISLYAARAYFDNVYHLCLSGICQRFGDLKVSTTLPGRISLSAYAGSRNDSLDCVAQRLAHRGVKAELRNSVYPNLFAKLLVASTSALMALRDASVGALFGTKVLHDESVELVKEGMRILSRYADRLPNSEETKLALASTFKSWTGGRVPGIPSIGQDNYDAITSLHQDLRSRRGQTEVTDINGEIVRLARRIQMEAPLNRALVDDIEQLARSRLTKRRRSVIVPNERSLTT